MSRLIPERSTKALTKSTPTWAQIFSQGNERDTWANKLEPDSQHSYDFLGPLRGQRCGGYKEMVREVTAEEPSIHVYLQAHS